MKAVVLFLLLISSPALAGAEEEDAMQHATLAAYKQFGIENAVNKVIENNVSKEFRVIINRVNPVITAIVSRRIELRWNF